jgi:TonB family protein
MTCYGNDGWSASSRRRVGFAGKARKLAEVVMSRKGVGRGGALLVLLLLLPGAGSAAAGVVLDPAPGGSAPAPPTAGAPPAGNEAEAALARGRQLLDSLRYEEAAAAFAAVSQALPPGDPYRIEALTSIGEVRLLEGRFSEAAATARQAIEETGAGGGAAGRARSLICQTRSHLTAAEAPMPPFQGNASFPGVPPAGDGNGTAADPRAANDPEAPLRIRAGVSKPVRLYARPPVYTETARKARLQGVVILESVIDRDGCVRDTRVLKPLPMGLDRAALDAVRDWVFAPARLEGHPVKVFFTLTIHFELAPPPPPAAPPPPQ